MVSISGGAKLEKALAEISRRVDKATAVRVGFLEGATYPDEYGTPVATVAAVQNFGAPSRGIPPRPFFSNMIRDKSPGWGPSLGRILKANNYDADTALDLMGEGIKGQLQQSIVDTNEPPLAESTIAAKGFEKPLIDTGHMFNSVDYEVGDTP